MLDFMDWWRAYEVETPICKVRWIKNCKVKSPHSIIINNPKAAVTDNNYYRTNLINNLLFLKTTANNTSNVR